MGVLPCAAELLPEQPCPCPAAHRDTPCSRHCGLRRPRLPHRLTLPLRPSLPALSPLQHVLGAETAFSCVCTQPGATCSQGPQRSQPVERGRFCCLQFLGLHVNPSGQPGSVLVEADVQPAPRWNAEHEGGPGTQGGPEQSVGAGGAAEGWGAAGTRHCWRALCPSAVPGGRGRGCPRRSLLSSPFQVTGHVSPGSADVCWCFSKAVAARVPPAASGLA